MVRLSSLCSCIFRKWRRGEKTKTGPSESEMEDKVAAAKKSCQALRDEEEVLRSQIAEEKRSWREEKTALVYAASAAEKEFGKQARSASNTTVRDDSSAHHVDEMRVSLSCVCAEAKKEEGRETDICFQKRNTSKKPRQRLSKL